MTQALGTVPSFGASITKATRVRLPTDYVTASGEARTARLTAGILTREAIVVDLSDGTRHVVGFWCQESTAVVRGVEQFEVVGCRPDPLDWWMSGNEPPYYPPDAVFG